MKRLLLSVCLVGIVFAGHTPNSLQTTQITTASADPFDAARAVTIVRKSAPDRWNSASPQNFSVQRVALRSSDTPDLGTPKGSALVPSVGDLCAFPSGEG